MQITEFSSLKYEADKSLVFNTLKKINESFLLELGVVYLAKITCSYSNAVLLPKVVVKLSEYREGDEVLSKIIFTSPELTYTKFLECIRHIAFALLNNVLSNKLREGYKDSNRAVGTICEIISQCDFSLSASPNIIEDIVTFLKQPSSDS